MSKNKQWLPHLINSIPENVRGYSLSSYCTILEAWRRGITVKFINKNRRKSEQIYSLIHDGKEHQFSVAKGDLVTKEAIRICKNKNLTKKYLDKADVSIPEGKTFEEDVKDSEIIDYADSLTYPVVLKPSDGTGGKGVIANIKNRKEFQEALTYVRYDLKCLKVIVEKYVKGEDFRVYVIDGKVIGGIKRLAANVTGDGTSSIRKLIEKKITKRNENPSLVGRPIKIDKELKSMLHQKGYTFDSIPTKGEQIFLKSKNNVSAGGESIDITDELTDEIKEIAIQAAQAIPGLVQCGVDLMVDTETNTGAVIEVNSMPHITAQLFPWEGKARDIPKAIIDYYFPETESNYRQPAYYFDYESIWENFKNGVVKEIVLPSCPRGDLSSTRFLVSGSVQRVNYGAWIRKHALRLNLNGYVKHLDNGNCSVVVSGPVESMYYFRDIINQKSPMGAEVTKVVEKSRKSPVKVGFEIMNPEIDKELVDGYYPIRLEGIKSHLNTKFKKATKKKGVKSKKATSKKSSSKRKPPKRRAPVKVSNPIDYKKKYNQLINSTSWKVTKPLRKISKILKGNE